jgi:cytochrome c oxidase accessory protein FixG
MAVTTALMFLDFAWFREQTCIVACPYGRFQSVLLDRHSLIVAYDPRRGESRSKLKRLDEWQSGARSGDCVDCHHCVVVCPTGIDIRDGLQMECIHCTQCIDACDAVMEKVDRPRGLIRYGSQEEMATGRRRLLRPRVVLYPLALGLVLGLLVWNLSTRSDTDLTMLRGPGQPYLLLPGGLVSNPVRVRVANKGERARRFWVTAPLPAGARLVAPINPVTVGPGALETIFAYLTLPREAYHDGRVAGGLTVTDSLAFSRPLAFTLLGPEEPEEEREDD